MDEAIVMFLKHLNFGKHFKISSLLLFFLLSEIVNPCETHLGGTVVFSVHEPSSTIITKINWFRIVDDVPR